MTKMEEAAKWIKAAIDADAAGMYDAAEAYEELAKMIIEEARNE